MLSELIYRKRRRPSKRRIRVSQSLGGWLITAQWVLTLAFCVLILPELVHAAPIQWLAGSGANGHAYEVVHSGGSWNSAKAAAEALTFQGVGGHLATIISNDENNFVASVIQAFENDQGVSLNLLWLGGQQLNPSDPPASGWG